MLARVQRDELALMVADMQPIGSPHPLNRGGGKSPLTHWQRYPHHPESPGVEGVETAARGGYGAGRGAGLAAGQQWRAARPVGKRKRRQKAP